MKAAFTSELVLLASQLALVLSTPTPTFPPPPTRRLRRAVGDTTSFPVSDTESWTFTITIQSGSGNDYDDDDLESLASSFNTAVANAAAGDDSATASYRDALGNGYELDLSLGDDETIGSTSRANWGVAGNVFTSWTTYQSYPKTFTAKLTNNSNSGAEIGFYEFHYYPID